MSEVRYCIATCIFNGYEPVREPLEVDQDADYYLFTDCKDTVSEKWNVIYLPELDTDSLTGVQKTYILKYTFHKHIDVSKYDYLIQLDSSIVIKRSLRPIVAYMADGGYDISVAPHFWKDNFRDEYEAWRVSRAIDQKYIDIFFNKVKDYDFYAIKGLVECSMKIYRCNERVFGFMDDVHRIMTESNDNNDKNDQCYFTYILYKHIDSLNVNYHSASLYRCSKYMQMYFHNTGIMTQSSEMVYPSYDINFLGRDITINRLDAYDEY